VTEALLLNNNSIELQICTVHKTKLNKRYRLSRWNTKCVRGLHCCSGRLNDRTWSYTVKAIGKLYCMPDVHWQTPAETLKVKFNL